MNLKRTQSKLMKNGYLPELQASTYEIWIDIQTGGTPISFSIENKKVKGAFKIHGRKEDRPEVDEYYSDYSRNLSEAIRYSRLRS